jgi:hypothetical protein
LDRQTTNNVVKSQLNPVVATGARLASIAWAQSGADFGRPLTLAPADAPASGGGGTDDNVNATDLQPVVSYTLKTATTFTLITESTYDWDNEQWTVPLNLMVQQLVKIGKQPVALTVGGRYYPEKPDGGPDWGLRFAVIFLFPK